MNNNSLLHNMSSQDQLLCKFNLVKAQKYLDKLKANVPSTSPSVGIRRRVTSSVPSQTKALVNLNQLVQLSTNEQKVLEAFDKSVQGSRNDLQSRLNVLRDLKNLKEHIYTTNAKIGLSDVLTKLDLLAEEKKIFEELRNNSQHAAYTKDNLLDALSNYNKSKESSSSSFDDGISSVQFRLYSEEELDETITKYTQEMTKLEDKRDKLNATTDVEFSFSRDSCKLLGIPFVTK